MRIVSVIDELVYKVQAYNIPLLPVQFSQSLTILNLQDAVQTAVDILYHLRDEEYTSYQSFKYTKAIQEYGISEDGAMASGNLEVVPDALLWKQQFRASFLSRLSTYTMTICGLDKLLEMTYQKFIEALFHSDYNHIELIKEISNGKKEKVLQTLLTPRRDEISHYKKLRDKVFAHTSYAQPKHQGKIDDEELQSVSLAFYSGFFMKYAKDHVYIQIGSPLVKTDDQINLNISKDYSGTIVPHYEQWSMMFKDILDHVR